MSTRKRDRAAVEAEKPDKQEEAALPKKEEEEVSVKPEKKKKREEKPAEKEEEDTTIHGRPFSEFDISEATVKALKAIDIVSMFPVQAASYDAIMQGKDVLVQARTGSGKTLAFGIPTVERIIRLGEDRTRGRGPAAVIFSPTRELAIQIRDVLTSIARGYTVVALYGGVAYATQERALQAGVDIVVATPGRATDFMEKGTLRFDRVNFVVLDEADHMLDIGFKDSIENLLRQIAHQNGSEKESVNTHQTMLFSATVPEWVKGTKFLREEREFIDLIGKENVKTANTIRFFKRQCRYQEVPAMLGDLIRVYSGKHGKTLVFTNTKKDCHDLSINNDIKLDAQCLHGDMQQEQRESTMKSFRENKFAVLIATDVAARGLDLPKVDLVIQAAPPSDIDSFIHRAGRTGRAGRKGVCVLLHTVKDGMIVEKIERHAKMKFEVLPPPSQQDILRAVTRDVTEDLARV